MEDENFKIFVGGVSQETSEETLIKHFNKYGEITKSEVIKNRITGCSRGFGFVTFANPSSLNQVLKDKHVILGRSLEVKKARPKGNKDEELNCQHNDGVLGSTRHNVNKIFVGGLPPMLTEEELRNYFENFGTVTDAVMIYDQENRPRGFGFVTFELEEVVKTVLENEFHTLKGKKMQVKKAKPKETNNNKLFGVLGGYNNGFGFCGQYYSNILPNGFYYGPNFYGTWTYAHAFNMLGDQIILNNPWSYNHCYSYSTPSNYSHFISHHNTARVNGVPKNGGGHGTTEPDVENGKGCKLVVNNRDDAANNNGERRNCVEDYPIEKQPKMEAALVMKDDDDDDDGVETRKETD